MTIADLLDHVASATGDKHSGQRENARRWLNLTRAYIADQYFWRSALDPSASLAAGVKASGVYTIGTSYEHVYGDLMYNATDNLVVEHESLAVIKGIDVDRSVSGPPTVWADAGMDSNGQRQVYLWPIPSTVTTVEFVGIKRMSSLSASNDNLSIDPYYGDIQSWAACFAAGMRYYSMDTDNEDAFSVNAMLSEFNKRIKARKAKDGAAPHATVVLADVRHQGGISLGRFDPAHYRN